MPFILFISIIFLGLEHEQGTVKFLSGTKHIRSNLQNQYQLLAGKG